MSGSKRQKVRKTDEIIYRLSLRADFQKEIRTIRKEFGISEDGFDNYKSICDWTDRYDAAFSTASTRRDKINPLAYHRRVAGLISKFSIPPTDKVRQLVESYILGSEEYNQHFRMIWSSVRDEFILIRAPLPDESDLDGRPFVTLKLYHPVSKTDALNFIRKEWPSIKRVLQRQTREPIGRVRSLLNKPRDQKIYQLSQRSRSELLKLAGEYVGRKNKEDLISIIVKKRHGWTVKPEAVKKAIQRYKERTRDT